MRAILGYHICSNAPAISHLLFANDMIIFCGAKEAQAPAVKELLYKNERASGQKLNYSKTTISFSWAVQNDKRSCIVRCLDIQELLAHYKYLGLPMSIGRSKKKSFLYIVNRIKSRLSNWMDRLVSWVGREVLIKVVAQAIPTYAMSVFKSS